ncbi:DUF1788 domain-containing protein [Myxococcota bacterium]|nr:DUF1788 domain-containing protein [Myxococcota bacterium]
MTPTPSWKARLTGRLEPALIKEDPRPGISAYHDMPFVVFVYPPEDELELRKEVTLLATRLGQKGKRVTRISLAECLAAALAAEGLGGGALAAAEREAGLPLAIETAFSVLAEYQRLDRLVAARVPKDADPLRDVVLLVRAGALYPLYRTSALLEQLVGQVAVPTVLFYPGETDGPAGLRFMGAIDAEHNYRPRIF